MRCSQVDIGVQVAVLGHVDADAHRLRAILELEGGASVVDGLGFVDVFMSQESTLVGEAPREHQTLVFEWSEDVYKYGLTQVNQFVDGPAATQARNYHASDRRAHKRISEFLN